MPDSVQRARDDERLARRYFRSACDYVVDALDPDPRDHRRALGFQAASQIEPGSLLYLSPKRDSDIFFRDLYPRIHVPVFLMTGGTGHPNPDRHGGHLEDRTKGGQHRILAWFCENADRAHERVVPIPIGIRQLFERALPALQDEAASLTTKSKLVCANFDSATADDRESLRALLEDAGFVDRIPYQPRRTWAVSRQILQYEFGFCPPGKGVDTYRCWEYLYCGVIPIMKRSHIDPLFEGLPVLLVDSWKEVSEPFLRERSREIRARFGLADGAAMIDFVRRAPPLGMAQHLERLSAVMKEHWPAREPLSLDRKWLHSEERAGFARAFDEWHRARPRFDSKSFEDECERRSALPAIWNRVLYLTMPAWSRVPSAWLRRKLYDRVYRKALPNGTSFSAIGWRALKLLQRVVLRKHDSAGDALRSLSRYREALSRDDNWEYAPDWVLEADAPGEPGPPRTD